MVPREDGPIVPLMMEEHFLPLKMVMVMRVIPLEQ